MDVGNGLYEGISGPEVNSLKRMSPSLELGTPHSNFGKDKLSSGQVPNSLCIVLLAKYNFGLHATFEVIKRKSATTRIL